MASDRTKIVLVVGARPNFMKIAPILEELRRHPEQFDPCLVHTGQHYDEKMSRIFFEELGMPEPDRYLGVGSGSQATQTARVMIAFEEVLTSEQPDLVLVVGDVNSTVACTLDAVKLHIPVGHVEAGLRSGDRTMPEEINRLVTDAISDLLFTPSRDADENLILEGVPRDRICFVGNVMIDSLRRFEGMAEGSPILDTLNLEPKGYGLVTLHRPSNVDQPEHFEEIIQALEEIQTRLPLIFPIHPRTEKRISEMGLQSRVEKMKDLRFVPPTGYLDFLKLQKYARLVLTDSGGIQEETTVLGVPCLTLRENTERPITVTEGTNQLVGVDRARIVRAATELFDRGEKPGRIPEGWDGKAAVRIVEAIAERLGEG
ncbi:MAG: UDP-N-acetylglucosamine 2-epimerase (non-hydrolyzing) [Candidatus Latescibacterota bacterium]